MIDGEFDNAATAKKTPTSSLDLFSPLSFLRARTRKSNLETLQKQIVTKIEWQSPLSIVQYPDPRLRAVNGRVGVFDENLERLAKEMFEVMYASEDGGVGLAAPQVGVNLRLMVFNPGKEREKEEEVVLVNPQVVSASGPIRGFEEGCLSFPGVYGEVLVSRLLFFCVCLGFGCCIRGRPQGRGERKRGRSFSRNLLLFDFGQPLSLTSLSKTSQPLLLLGFISRRLFSPSFAPPSNAPPLLACPSLHRLFMLTRRDPPRKIPKQKTPTQNNSGRRSSRSKPSALTAPSSRPCSTAGPAASSSTSTTTCRAFFFTTGWRRSHAKKRCRGSRGWRSFLLRSKGEGLGKSRSTLLTGGEQSRKKNPFLLPCKTLIINNSPASILLFFFTSSCLS